MRLRDNVQVDIRIASSHKLARAVRAVQTLPIVCTLIRPITIHLYSLQGTKGM